MALNITTYFAAQVLNTLRAASITAPTNVYIALYTSAPTDAGGGTEVSGTAYARQAVTFGAPSGAVPNAISNSSQITFPTALSNWGTVTNFAILDALTGGNMLWTQALTTSMACPIGSEPKVTVGSLILTLD